MGALGEWKRHVRQLRRDDKDPAKWPVAEGARVYMVECSRCKSKVHPTPVALANHERKCRGS